MDFDSIISFLLILLFFVFPTLLKRLSKKKKTTVPTAAGNAKNPKTQKLSLFEKLGEQIREYAQTLEQETAKGKQPRETQENIWDHLAGDDEFQSPSEQDPVVEVDPPALAAARSVPEKLPGKKENQLARKPEKSGSVCDPSESSRAGIFGQAKLSSCQLQQAIVWSEILSKPVALRRNE